MNSCHAEVQQKMQQYYQAAFGSLPAVTVFAPGRVEVLGNHTDYNEGYALDRV